MDCGKPRMYMQSRKLWILSEGLVCRLPSSITLVLKIHAIRRTPENCAYTPLMHPACLSSAIKITPSSPRTHHLLNSGLVVLKPSPESAKLVSAVLEGEPELVSRFTFADQDLFAHVFRNLWKPLPYTYNALKTLRKTHSPIWRDEDVRCVHYILKKPWAKRPPPPGEEEESGFDELNRWWWADFDKVVGTFEGHSGKELILSHVGQWVHRMLR